MQHKGLMQHMCVTLSEVEVQRLRQPFDSSHLRFLTLRVTQVVQLIAFVAVLIVLSMVPANAGTSALDSQVVLRRYEAALDAVETPKNAIFTYAISQAGPTNIEQRHRVYRSEDNVRDETLAGDGVTVKQKATVILKRTDRYAIRQVAPRPTAYAFVFVRTIAQAGRVMYLYDTQPYSEAATSGFIVTQVLIDGIHFLPRTIAFHATNGE